MTKKTSTSPIRAITLDLDDTLWPIWPAIRRAEEHLFEWLKLKAPATAAATSVDELRELRNMVEEMHPKWRHDLSAYRREAIRFVLAQNGDDESLADEGFNVFFQMRQQVDLFDDALPALEYLSARYPVVAVSNGNADLKRMGLSQFFKASISAQSFGVSKPDVRIYHEAARHTGVNNLDEILHIGDDMLLDVMGANNAGFQTAWLIRSGMGSNIGADIEVPNSENLDISEKIADFQINNLLELREILKA